MFMPLCLAVAGRGSQEMSDENFAGILGPALERLRAEEQPDGTRCLSSVIVTTSSLTTLRPHTASLKAGAGVIRIMATLRSASPPLPAAMALPHRTANSVRTSR